MNEHLERLEPQPLWRHFRTLCNTPRPSGHEAALVALLEAWADEQGLAHDRDAFGNLRLRKPATPGCEGAPGVILQAHLDMVPQANAGSAHDFTRDPIRTRIGDDGWLRATDTTLGADNGLGAAAALAILEDDTLTHGPLEALLDRKSTRLNSSHVRISYAVFCLKKKKLIAIPGKIRYIWHRR